MKALLLAFFLLLTTLGWSAPAFAHTVETDYLINAQSALEIRSHYSTGEPMERAVVKVYSPSDPSKPWMESTTDTEGRFAFLPDRSIPGDWTVKIGQTDHGDALTVEVTDKGVELAPDVKERADGSKQLVVVGFAALMGGIGKKLASRQKTWF
jgi:nickel transport protein